MAFYLFDDFVRFRKKRQFPLISPSPWALSHSDMEIDYDFKWLEMVLSPHSLKCLQYVRALCMHIFSSNNVEMVSMAVMLQSDIIL